MCEGFSIDDVVALGAAHIAEYGYGIQGVVGPDGADNGFGSWVYTVGLLDAAGHPELIIAGGFPDWSASVLSLLAGSTLAGERYLVDETIDLGDGGVARVGSVHEIQYELDTFNMWHNLKNAGVLHAPELEAVQITVSDVFFPPGQQSLQPSPASPTPTHVSADADSREVLTRAIETVAAARGRPTRTDTRPDLASQAMATIRDADENARMGPRRRTRGSSNDPADPKLRATTEMILAMPVDDRLRQLEAESSFFSSIRSLDS